MIAIIDYGMGNLASVQKALTYLGFESIITDDAKAIDSADGVILPGVGAFAPAMKALQSKNLDVAVKKAVSSGKPFLGVCLGMQLLFDGSEEGASNGELIKGLSIIPGKVLRFPEADTTSKGLKVPQIGWNSLADVTGSLICEDDYVYFVHSYYCAPEKQSDVAAYTTYGIKYAVAIERDNVFCHSVPSGKKRYCWTSHASTFCKENT